MSAVGRFCSLIPGLGVKLPSTIAPRGVRQEVPVLVNCAPLHRHAVPDGGDGLLQSRRTVDDGNSGRRRPRLIRSSSTVRQASVLSPPMLLIASSTFWPSARTPITTSSEIAVALRSSRTRTTVPSRMSRTIGSRPASACPRLPVGLHLAPHPAHRVLAHRAAKQRRERPADPTCVGAGEVGRGNQGVHLPGPLFSPQ